MFNFLKKNIKNQEKNNGKALFSLSGLHCSSCTLLIDSTLEDLPGVLKSQSNYAQQKTVVEFDETKTSIEKLRQAIEKTGYQAKLIK